jgi:CheY-like chemotaxis protein
MILMDTDMPRGMYGYEACRIIREQCSRPLVIIGLSNIATEERKRLWLEAGADDFFDKDVPDVDSSGFYQTLDNYLNGLEH